MMQTIPTRMVERRDGELIPLARRDALQEAYLAVEGAQFTDPDDRERYAEIMLLIRAQRRENSAQNRSQRLGGKAVLPRTLGDLEQFEEERNAVGQKRGRRHLLIRQKTAREVWDDELVRAGLQPILEELTIAQRDAVRFVWDEGLTRRETGARLSIVQSKVTERLQRAYERIRAYIPEEHYRRVRQYLRDAGAKIGVSAGSRSDLPPDSQRPRISERRTIAVERGESFRDGYAQHDCSLMCRPTPSRVYARTSTVGLVPIAFASVRHVAQLANSVRIAYRVPDREVAA